MSPVPCASGPPAAERQRSRCQIASCCHVERSLQRLRIDPIDLLQIHSMNGTDELMPLLQQWKRPGRMRRYPIDLVQVDYSIGNRGVEREIFLVARTQGSGHGQRAARASHALAASRAAVACRMRRCGRGWKISAPP